jgi:hypothetical protein
MEQVMSAWPRQSECNAFYGPVGTNQVTLQMPYPLRIAWKPEDTITRIQCHAKVHDAAKRVFERVLEVYGLAEIQRLRLDMFGGCLNVRKMRGGNAWSMHSWGIAFDFDPENNQLNHTRASFAREEYKAWFDAWYEQGAIGLGPERNFDWMHTQFANL